MITLNIKVKPGSFKDEISIDAQGLWLVKIREKPIDGAANEALIHFLSKALNLRKSDIDIAKGHNSQFKKIVLNIDEEKLKAFVEKL
ncbi:MAG: DUF167 domain-containing protein [Flavobacteriales bacterium]